MPVIVTDGALTPVKYNIPNGVVGSENIALPVASTADDVPAPLIAALTVASHGASPTVFPTIDGPNETSTLRNPEPGPNTRNAVSEFGANVIPPFAGAIPLKFASTTTRQPGETELVVETAVAPWKELAATQKEMAANQKDMIDSLLGLLKKKE